MAAAVSILIPAHGEGSAITATLDALAAQDFDGAMQVVVCVNGDAAHTADFVREAAQRHARLQLQLIELPQAHKPGALNAADRLATTRGPRIYLDADTVLSPRTVGTLVAALATDEPRVAAPRKVLAPGTPWLVAALARAWLTLPWVQGDVVGSGVVAVNAAGRARWGEFPDVIADDGFAAWQFAPHERVIVADGAAAIRFPSRVLAMLRTQRRWIAGGEQLDASPHRPPHGPAWSGRQRLRAMLRSPRVLVAALVTRVQRVVCRLLPAPQRASW